MVKDVAQYVTMPEAFDEVKNFRFNSKGAVSVHGHEPVMSPAPYPPLWLKMFPPLENPYWVYADLTRVGAFQDSHYNITRLSGLYNAVPNERWTGDVFSGVGIFNNTVDVPQQWLEFSGVVPLEDLAHWPSTLRCKFIRPFKQFLIAGNLTNGGIRQPARIRWSHPADPGTVPASWVINDPAIDAGEYDIAETADECIDAQILGDQFIVYKQKSVHAMQFIGGTDIFSRRELFATRGVLTRDCIQPIPIGHFVVGVDDIYVHSGQRGSDTSLLDNRLRDWVFNQINKDNYFYCYTLPWRRQNEIWFAFPETGETYPTLALIYNTVTHGIGVKDLPKVPFMYPGPVIKANVAPTWDGL